jgi:hypothetical protein
MKGRCAGALLLALCLFALAGCGGNAKGTEYAVYYCNQAAGEEAALVAEKRVLPPDTEPVGGASEPAAEPAPERESDDGHSQRGDTAEVDPVQRTVDGGFFQWIWGALRH